MPLAKALCLFLKHPATSFFFIICNFEGKDVHFTQTGILFHTDINGVEKNNTVHIIVYALKGINDPKGKEGICRQLYQRFRADEKLGKEMAIG